MDTLIYYFISGLIAVLRALPLTWAAGFGRFMGGLVYLLDARHRRVAQRNLTMCFGAEKSPEEIRALARENFKRIGENFVAAINLSARDQARIEGRVELVGEEKLLAHTVAHPGLSSVLAIGHFGNFELFAHLQRLLPSHQRATSYRSVKNAAANRVLLKLRNRSGCLYFERRTEGAALRTALRGGKLILGLLADQHSGENGLRLPFLGHECNTTKSPAVFALRFNTPLHTAFCYRTAPARWRVEVGEEIPTHENGRPRSVADIMLDVNRAFEVAVRRDPANWFWVHNRWKQPKTKVPAPAPAAEAAGREFGDGNDSSGGNHQRLSGQY
jgi:KDO2-lipid IV(A) lauroyltransferase